VGPEMLRARVFRRLFQKIKAKCSCFLFDLTMEYAMTKYEITNHLKSTISKN
jgi:hypothetical protein